MCDGRDAELIHRNASNTGPLPIQAHSNKRLNSIGIIKLTLHNTIFIINVPTVLSTSPDFKVIDKGVGE